MVEYDEELICEIIENVDIVDLIGEYLPLQKRGTEWFGKCPFHDENTASFSISPQKHVYYCFGCGCKGDAITFCREYLKMSYDDSVKYLAGLAGISVEKTEICSSIKLFKQMKRSRQIIPTPTRHKILDEDILKRFEYKNIVEWEKEGIPQTIMDQYGVAYDRRIDPRLDKIIYPVYDIDGNLINIKGRTLCENYKAMVPPIPKYINYFPVGDLDYFQGLNYKYDYIRERGEIIIFESFKSVMKADSFGYKNSVSAETSKINIYQLKILIGMHVDVVLAFDADMPFKKVKNDDKTQVLSRFTNVYIISDEKHHLLGNMHNKNSPVDCGKEIWTKLYAEKVKIC